MAQQTTNPSSKDKKLKRFFYFMFKQDFFQREEMKEIRSAAEECGDNPNDYYIFWLKLIAHTLSTRGILRKINLEPLSESYLKNLLDFQTSGTAKETIALISRIVIALEKKKLIYFLPDRTAIKIPIVLELTRNKSEEVERVEQWQLEQAALNKQFEEVMNPELKHDPKYDFEIYFEKTFAGLIYYNYAKSSERDSYKATLKLLFEDFKDKNLDLATEEFMRTKLHGLAFDKITNKVNYMDATLRAFIKSREKQIDYEAIKIIRSNKGVSDSPEIKELQKIASFDWVNGCTTNKD